MTINSYIPSFSGVAQITLLRHRLSQKNTSAQRSPLPHHPPQKLLPDDFCMKTFEAIFKTLEVVLTTFEVVLKIFAAVPKIFEATFKISG
jgi:hypothetical protein